MKKLLFTLLFALFSMLIQAQESQTEYNFLRLPVSAHAAALGGENITIIEDDPSLMFSNPALASSVSDKTVGISYMNYMHGANYMGASYTKALGEKATLAGGVQYMSYGRMKEVDANNVQTGSFNASEMAIEAILAYELAPNLMGGITAKLITSHIANYSSMAVGVDLALNWYEPERLWSVSLVGKNLGGQIKAYEENYGKMPIDLQVGVSKTFEALPIRVSATMVDLTHKPLSLSHHLCLGAEVLLSESIWIGGGYNFRKGEEMIIGNNDEASAHGAGFSLGGGINLEQFKLNLAWGKYHAASSSILVNLAYSF